MPSAKAEGILVSLSPSVVMIRSAQLAGDLRQSNKLSRLMSADGLPKVISSRIAISGVIAPRPLQILERVLRLAPSLIAALLILMPKGFKTSRCRITPAWEGLKQS